VPPVPRLPRGSRPGAPRHPRGPRPVGGGGGGTWVGPWGGLAGCLGLGGAGGHARGATLGPGLGEGGCGARLGSRGRGSAGRPRAVGGGAGHRAGACSRGRSLMGRMGRRLFAVFEPGERYRETATRLAGVAGRGVMLRWVCTCLTRAFVSSRGCPRLTWRHRSVLAACAGLGMIMNTCTCIIMYRYIEYLPNVTAL
jgi:hypothetical protein